LCTLSQGSGSQGLSVSYCLKRRGLITFRSSSIIFSDFYTQDHGFSHEVLPIHERLRSAQEAGSPFFDCIKRKIKKFCGFLLRESASANYIFEGYHFAGIFSFSEKYNLYKFR